MLLSCYETDLGLGDRWGIFPSQIIDDPVGSSSVIFRVVQAREAHQDHLFYVIGLRVGIDGKR